MAAKSKKIQSSYSFLGSRLLLPLVILVLTAVIILDGEKSSSLLSNEQYSGQESSSEEESSAIEENGKSVEELAFQEIKSSAAFNPQENKDSTDVIYESPAVCNYGKGRWVEDHRRPLYTGAGCERWLSGPWVCRLTSRTDFSFEKYRWQPSNCNLPEFDSTSFLTRMKDKTIAFIGDSIGMQQFQSLMCMSSQGQNTSDVQDVAFEYDLTKPLGARRPNGYAYRFLITNTTIVFYWSATLADIEPLNKTDPETKAMHLDRPPAFLARFIDRFDVVVLNTGHHWNTGKFKANHWRSHVDGMPVEDGEIKMIGYAKRYTVRNIAKWLDLQISLRPGLKVFFRTISPRHFFHGDWNTGGSCDNTVPLTRGREVEQDGSSDRDVEGAVNTTRVKMLDITALSALRDEAHISRYSFWPYRSVNDCLHWCLPGIPDTWNEILVALI